MHKYLEAGAVAALLSLFAPAPVHADIITQTRAFALSSAATLGGGGDVGVLLFDQFDSTLGTLDSVDVSINGQLMLFILLPASFVTEPVPMPLPYVFHVRATLDFGGQASDFLLTPEVRVQGEAPGGVAPFQLTAFDLFTHSFSYTAASDLPGLAAVTTANGPFTSLGTVSTIPPTFTSGQREDFDAPVPGFPLLVTPQLVLAAPLFAGATVPETFGGVVTAGGSVRIVYNFTPNVQTVPEPATTVLLVGGGAAALAPRRRRQRQRM